MTRYDDDIAFSSTNHSKMVYSGNRQAVFFPNVPLNFCKELKNAASGTINDGLMVAFAQAVQDYSNSVEGFKPVTTKTQCRALLPIALPRKMDSKSTALRNRWCMVSMDLGVKCETLADRLHHVHSETTKLKSSPRAYIQMWIQNALLPLSPQIISNQIDLDNFSRHSVVFSNDTGPASSLGSANALSQSLSSAWVLELCRHHLWQSSLGYRSSTAHGSHPQVLCQSSC